MKAFHRRLQNLRNFTNRHHQLIAPAALIIGFVLDNLTLNRIDQIFDQALLVVHLLIVSVSMAAIFRWYRLGERSRIPDRWVNWLYTAMAFSIGGIYSGLVIFYGRSGSLLNSWPLLLILVVFLFGSEFAKRYFKALSIQLVALFTALYLYLAILIPLIFHDMSTGLFLLATGIWLVLAFGYLVLLARLGRIQKRRLIMGKGWIIGAVLVVIAGSYFAKVLPPVPLSIKLDAVYHRVVRAGDGYQADYEANPAWRFWDKRSNTLTLVPGDRAYVFTSVFAPDKFTARIYHEWQYKKEGKWVTTDRIPMTIVGGADRGYRGYSYKSNLPGDAWRIRTVTDDGRVIGLTFLRIDWANAAAEVITEEL